MLLQKTSISLTVRLTELVLFRRSEKSILVKMTRFWLFERIFKFFSNFPKSETSNFLQVKFWEYHKWELFWKTKKHQKMRFYEKVWFLWWLRYSQKSTCNKFEISGFWNFEKQKCSKRQKHVIFTKMLFSLRRNKTSSVKCFKMFWYFRESQNNAQSTISYHIMI